MLKQLFKLTPEQYESLYSGELVTSSDTNTTLQLNTTTFALTMNGSTILSRTEYSIEVSDTYLTPTAVEDMFDDVDSVASTQDVASLFNSFTPENRQTIVDLVYPVGSVYTTTNTNENTVTLHNRLGGTWAEIKDRFLLAAGDTYTNGDTGGEATHTLTVDEMPSHSHTFNVFASAGNFGTSRLCSSDGAGLNYNVDSGTYNTGGGQAHNNMPPYLVVKMFRRTA